MLRELAEIGMDLARRLYAEPPGDAKAERDRELALARLSRAVRQTLALEARLDEDQDVLRDRLKAEADQRRAAAETARAEAVFARHRQVRAVLEPVIKAETLPRQRQRRFSSLYERLRDESEDEDFLSRPFWQLVAQIRKDLGLPPDASLMAEIKAGAEARADWPVVGELGEPAWLREASPGRPGSG